MAGGAAATVLSFYSSRSSRHSVSQLQTVSKSVSQSASRTLDPWPLRSRASSAAPIQRAGPSVACGLKRALIQVVGRHCLFSWLSGRRANASRGWRAGRRLERRRQLLWLLLSVPLSAAPPKRPTQGQYRSRVIVDYWTGSAGGGGDPCPRLTPVLGSLTRV
jgi:hypothetical protein